MAKDKGFEYLDDTPVEVPVKLRRNAPDAWSEMVRRVVEQVSAQAREKGGETFEESMDFGPDEDEDMGVSPSEMRYLREEELLTEALEASRIRDERRRAARKLKELNRGNEAAAVRKDGGVDGNAGVSKVGAAGGGKARSASDGVVGVQGAGGADSVGDG